MSPESDLLKAVHESNRLVEDSGSADPEGGAPARAVETGTAAFV